METVDVLLGRVIIFDDLLEAQSVSAVPSELRRATKGDSRNVILWS